MALLAWVLHNVSSASCTLALAGTGASEGNLITVRALPSVDESLPTSNHGIALPTFCSVSCPVVCCDEDRVVSSALPCRIYSTRPALGRRTSSVGELISCPSRVLTT